MALEVNGKLIMLLPPQSGMGKNGAWTKQEFVIETNEQYPKKICISAWGDKGTQVAQIPVGTSVKVSVNIESREFNSKWYTDVRMWAIQVENSGIDPVYPDTQYADSMPMGTPAPAPQAPMPDSAPAIEFADSSDDLPF